MGVLNGFTVKFDNHIAGFDTGTICRTISLNLSNKSPLGLVQTKRLTQSQIHILYYHSQLTTSHATIIYKLRKHIFCH